MNRRAFSAALAALPLAAQSTGKVKAAFLGASHSHAFDKVRLVKGHPRYELAGVWEPSTAVHGTLAKLGELRFLDKAEILKDPSIQVIFVESDVKTHAPLALEAVSAGKHVHIEKPPAENFDDFRQIVGIAREKRLFLQTGYMWRFNPAVMNALEAAREGWLGDVYMIHARMNTLIDADRRPEWNLFSGGQMFEQGAHLIDVVVRLLGLPKRITPFLRHDGAFSDTLKDNTAAVLEWDRTIAVITSSVLQPNATAHRTIEIFGTNGNAVIRPIEPPSLEIDLAKAAGPYVKGRQKALLPKYERYAGDLDEMAAAVLDNQPLSVTLTQEMHVQEVLLTASRMR